MGAKGTEIMSDLAQQIAREHIFSWGNTRNSDGECSCGDSMRGIYGHSIHVAEVTEAAVREHLATEVEAHMRRHDEAQIGFSAVGDAYANAARIARGES